MDFKKITDSTRNYNFHSHTQFCDGHADMITMARAAVACGMEHYGFTPHSPFPVKSCCNMEAEAVEAYLAEAQRIKELPELSACRFYTGMEIDYVGPEWGASTEYFKSLPLDYSISSVHFIPAQDGELVDTDGKFDGFKKRMADRFRGDIEYVVHTFYEQSKQMLKLGGFDILGHFDKISLNASYYAPGILDSHFYAECFEPYMQMILERKTTVEINTKHFREHGRFFPNERHLPRLVANGNLILVNSDAHQPDRIEASRAEAFAIIDNIKNGTKA